MSGLRHRARWILGIAWLALLGVLIGWIVSHGLSIRDVMWLTYHHVIDNPLAPVVYIVLYTLRPLTFFPAMWMTLAAGSLFGFIPGLIYGLIGENLSANFAYALARFFRSKRLAPGDTSRIAVFNRTLQAHAFPTVVVLRASFLPFDLVNYACGLLKVRWLAYALGSLIGMLPPMVTFVSFGATVQLPKLLKNQSFSPEQLIDARQLLISAGLLAASAVIAVLAARRRKRLQRQAEDDSN